MATPIPVREAFDAATSLELAIEPEQATELARAAESVPAAARAATTWEPATEPELATEPIQATEPVPAATGAAAISIASIKRP